MILVGELGELINEEAIGWKQEGNYFSRVSFSFFARYSVN